MKPAREPASSCPMPCASLKKPHETCPFAAPCGPRREKNDLGQTPSFPLRNLPVRAFNSFAQEFSLPWLVDDRAALRVRRICCVPTRWSATRLSATVLPVSRVPPPSRRAPNWSSEEARTWEHHPQPTIPLPSLNRQAESRKQAASWLHLSRVSPALHPPERPSHTHTPKPGFGGRGRVTIYVYIYINDIRKGGGWTVLVVKQATCWRSWRTNALLLSRRMVDVLYCTVEDSLGRIRKGVPCTRHGYTQGRGQSRDAGSTRVEPTHEKQAPG